MTSVDSNFNFLCGRPHGDGPPPPVHMRPPEPDPLPPPCGRHKWMAPYENECIHSECHAVLSINVSTLIKIVIVISRFLERPQKRSRGNQLIHRRVSNQNR